ncbi:hypothetical protein [Clostridium sp.]|uniref:hypothetical protein n=1 Tax=Clostridium sp. TaxID=1506 RepID=UPI003217A253
MKVNKRNIGYIPIILISLGVIGLTFSFVKIQNLEYRNNVMIRNNYSCNLRTFSFVMNDFNNKIKEANTNDEKIKVIDEFGERLDYINLGLDFSAINDNLKGPIKEFVYYLNEVNLEKFKNDLLYSDKVLNTIAKSCAISSQMNQIAFEDIFENQKTTYFTKLKLSDETNNYFKQIQELFKN